jgi:hypothetical protein
MYFLRTQMQREQFTLAQLTLLVTKLHLVELLEKWFFVMVVLVELF